jgi:hypothetical protein
MDRFFRFRREVTARPRKEGFDPVQAERLLLRQGMWVQTSSGVGILLGLTAEGVARVMLVDEEGLNRLEISTSSASLRQATFAEIPDPRKPHPDLGDRMGYRRVK